MTIETKGLRPYSAYWASGVDWLADLPQGWRILRLKRIAEVLSEKMDAKPVNVPYIGLEHIASGVGKLSVVPGKSGAQADSAVTVFKPGDVLFGKLRPYLAKAFLANFNGVGSTELAVLRPSNQLNANYLLYTLLSDALIGLLTSATYGSKMPRVSPEQLAETQLPLPPISEQRAIVSFLDRETAQLDGLIERKQRLLKLLEEQRQAVISQAVTRGLNPHAALKDSDVSWLGLVPEGWEVTPLKFEARMESGHTPSRTVEAYWVGCDIPWISLFDTAQLKQQKIIYETKNMISRLGMSNSSARLLPAGSVVLSRDATVGRVGIMGIEMATSQHFVAWVCGERLFNEYLYWVLDGPMQNHFLSLTNGATISTIGMPEIRQFTIPLPPLSEQHAIAAYLDTETAKLDALRQKLEQSIARLREYRAALITAAVTGQIDVREEVN